MNETVVERKWMKEEAEAGAVPKERDESANPHAAQIEVTSCTNVIVRERDAASNRHCQQHLLPVTPIASYSHCQ